MAATTNELQKAINRLVQIEPGWKEFTKPPAKGAKPATVGKGVPKGGGSGGAGGGSDESDYTLRQYWPVNAVSTITTSDGILTFEVQAIKSVELVGGGRDTYKEPVAS